MCRGWRAMRCCGFATDEHYAAWGALEHAVRTGESAFAHVHGASAWKTMEANPPLARVFDRSMSCSAAGLQAAFLDTYDLGFPPRSGGVRSEHHAAMGMLT